MIDDISAADVSPWNGRRAGRHLVEHDAEREDVAAAIQRARLDLLGRHVGPGAEDRARLRELQLRGILVRTAGLGTVTTRQAEVQDLDPAIVGDHHVAGFQVAVGDLLLVRGAERVGKRGRDVEEPRHRDAGRGDHLVERPPFDQLHRQEADAPVQSASSVEKIVTMCGWLSARAPAPRG